MAGPDLSWPPGLVRFEAPSWPSPRHQFAIDGKRLFFTVGTRQSDIWAMELRAGRISLSRIP
jgi:hypothetical protein